MTATATTDALIAFAYLAVGFRRLLAAAWMASETERNQL